MNYRVSDSSVKIENTEHFNHNPEMKKLIESMLEDKPSLEIVKVTNPACIKDIENVIAMNEEMKNSSTNQRNKINRQAFVVGSTSRQKSISSTPNPSRLLNALSGHRYKPVVRLSSPTFAANNSKSLNFKKKS